MKVHLKVLAVFLSVLILFQGCTIYRSAKVTLQEAVQADTKVKIKDKYDQTIKYKRVKFENTQFYGVTKKNNKKVYIEEKNINSVQLRNGWLSVIFSVWLSLLPVATLDLIKNGLY